ncbi:MAG: M48 family metallopeptidase [Thiotrichaceae bacterium]|nr:M48 family metallopeptidase [Thiotrichaceae bacterium]
MLSFPAATIELPDIGISANTVMSPADEQKLGENFIRQLRRQVFVIEDAQINNYINALGNRLASYSNKPEQKFNFFVIKDSSINAFAVPGGFVGIHSGLILKTHSESELASVVAHEISHVTQRHIARMIADSKRFSLPAMAVLIAAVLMAGAGNPEVGQAAAAAVMAGNVQMQINFTRTHETEADHIGMQILAKAGFEAHDMPSFFERLQAAGRYHQGVPDFLRTHPVTTDRIAEARVRAEKYPRQQKKDTPLYHLMKAKLLILTADNKHSLKKKLEKMLKTGRYRDERAIRYALALTLLATQQGDAVQTQIDWLFKNDADRIIYHLLKANLALLQNKFVKAMQVYEQALQAYPGDKMLGISYAEKLLQNNIAQKAKAVLLKIPSSSNPYYYHLLAKAYQATGAIATAHLTLANSYHLMGQTKLALEQIKLARQQQNRNSYLTSRIETRYKELTTQLLEEKMVSKY